MGLDTLDETRPFDTDPVSLGDDAIRETRKAIKDSFFIEHYLTGEHGFAIGNPATGRPPPGKLGRLFINTVNNNIEYDNGSSWVATASTSAAGSSVYQRVSAFVGINLNFSGTETVMVTFPSITTRGGTLRIYGMWGAFVEMAANSNGFATVRIYRGAQQIATATVYVDSAGANNTTVPLATPSFSDAPGAGAYSYTIRGITSVTSGTIPKIRTTSSNSGIFVLEEAA
jgi:hypothetical protein